MLTLFNVDLQHLGNIQNYAGWLRGVDIRQADGSVDHLWSLVVEAQFVQPETLIPWGPWFREQAVIRALVPGVDRLANAEIRDYLVFFFGIRIGIQQFSRRHEQDYF